MSTRVAARRRGRKSPLDGEVVLLEGLLSARGVDYTTRALLAAARTVMGRDLEASERKRIERLTKALRKAHTKMRRDRGRT